MAQLRDHWVDAEHMVRSRAWREGYESYRLGRPHDFSGPKSRALAYEYGRFTAAWLKAKGAHLPRITPMRPMNDAYVRPMARSMLEALEAEPRDWDAP